ncbi:metal ABC transporter solute-binding protein, Zn/Mn family [Desulfovermiculus halophilus]|jgi:zinc transport system substrate-binding protein|uniref:metal ABC transporter solute-binding protein, Zn/Mn family n=1 Tax=Desulfovermiculus halophilus TaxID=339722 RepID=UPI0004824C19|nr:zinc ABC transporter substrate-binding protein [Desulfovermiculus halophilus]
MARILSLLPILAVICWAPGLYAAQINAFVSIPPLAYFVQAIGGSRVDVNVMVHPGSNPAVYEPKPSQLSQLTESQIYFAAGVPFERAWLERIRSANPDLHIEHTDKAIPKKNLPSTYSFTSTQQEVAGGDHKGGKDPHVWLSPQLARKIAENVCRGLARVDPQNTPTYTAHLSELLQDIDALHQDLQSTLAPVSGRSFLVFHPAWGYFARTYNLHQVAVELEGKTPKPSQLAKLITFARRKNIQAIFVQPQFSAKSARTIAREIGAEVIVADPLARDWAANLREQARTLRRVLDK